MIAGEMLRAAIFVLLGVGIVAGVTSLLLLVVADGAGGDVAIVGVLCCLGAGALEKMRNRRRSTRAN